VTLRRTELVLYSGVLEGECGYRSPYGGGYVGNPLMWTLQRRLISMGICGCGPICGVDKPLWIFGRLLYAVWDGVTLFEVIH
jgi:hypothetical protein